MTNAIYATSIPVFKQMLGGLKQVLSKADTTSTATKMHPNERLQARLYPDRYTPVRTSQVTSAFAHRW